MHTYTNNCRFLRLRGRGDVNMISFSFLLFFLAFPRFFLTFRDTKNSGADEAKIGTPRVWWWKRVRLLLFHPLYVLIEELPTL